jgi:hypothetical protein
MLQLQLFFLLVPPTLIASGIWLAWFLHRSDIQETWDRCAIIERKEPLRPKLRELRQSRRGGDGHPRNLDSPSKMDSWSTKVQVTGKRTASARSRRLNSTSRQRWSLAEAELLFTESHTISAHRQLTAPGQLLLSNGGSPEQ